MLLHHATKINFCLQDAIQRTTLRGTTLALQCDAMHRRRIVAVQDGLHDDDTTAIEDGRSALFKTFWWPPQLHLSTLSFDQ